MQDKDPDYIPEVLALAWYFQGNSDSIDLLLPDCSSDQNIQQKSVDNLQYTVDEIICDVVFFLFLPEIHLSFGFVWLAENIHYFEHSSYNFIDKVKNNNFIYKNSHIIKYSKVK